MVDYTKSIFKMDDLTSLAGVTLNGESKLSYIKERAQLEELKQDLECEKAARIKAEKSKEELMHQIEELNEKLEEESYQCKIMGDYLVKKDAEINKLKSNLEEIQNLNESQNTNLKKKYQDSQTEMVMQIDNLNMIRHRLEKEKHVLQREKDQIQLDLEVSEKSKINLEKITRTMEAGISEVKKKLETSQKEIMELAMAKNQLIRENVELNNQLSSNKSQNEKVSKMRQSLTMQLEDAKAAMEDMMKQSTRVYEENRRLTSQIKSLEEKLESEVTNSSEFQKQTAKLSMELTAVRKKLEVLESKGPSTFDFEDIKKRLTSRISELERQLENVLSRCVGLEKIKSSMQNEIEKLKADLEQRQNQMGVMDKKHRQHEKHAMDWKAKEVTLETELEDLRRECRAQASENSRLKGEVEEQRESYETLIKDHHNLSIELQDMIEQCTLNKKRIMELEKMVKRLEMEKQTMQSNMDDLESLNMEELNKFQKIIQEVNSARVETEKQLSEKDVELDCLRKTHQKSINEMQSFLDQENKSRLEVLRQKQILEQELLELSEIIETTKQANEDLRKQIAKLTLKVKELEKELEEERYNSMQVERDKTHNDDKLSSHTVKIHELNMEIESLERTNKSLHEEMQEISHKSDKLQDLNALLVNEKKALESQLKSLQCDLEDKVSEIEMVSEHSKRAADEASMLVSELKKEQEKSFSLDRVSKNLENKLKEIQAKLHEAEATAMQKRKCMSMCWVRNDLVCGRPAARSACGQRPGPMSSSVTNAVSSAGRFQGRPTAGGANSRARNGIGKRTSPALGNFKGDEKTGTAPEGALHFFPGRKVRPPKTARSSGKISAKAQVLQKTNRRAGRVI